MLTAMLVCHYLADYVLTTQSMIKAKAKGWPPLPILAHAAVHATLIGAVVALWGCIWQLVVFAFFFELITHFLIDTAKGVVTAHFPRTANVQGRAYWAIHGLDQLCHLLVIVSIAVYCS